MQPQVQTHASSNRATINRFRKELAGNVTGCGRLIGTDPVCKELPTPSGKEGSFSDKGESPSACVACTTNVRTQTSPWLGPGL